MMIVLAGLPAAGKSHLADRLARLIHDREGRFALVLASDTVRDEIPALKKGFLPEVEPFVRKLFMERVASVLRQGLDVIVDDMNYYRSMRFDWVAMCRELEAVHAFLHIATPEERCLALNAARGSKVPDEVIVKDAARFDPPGEDSWDTPLAALIAPDLDEEGLEKLLDQLEEHRENYVPWEPPEKPEHVRTLKEELDLLARSMVGALYKGGARPRAGGQEISAARIALVNKASDQGLTVDEAEPYFQKELAALFLEG